MNFLWFIIFGFISSLLGVVLSTISSGLGIILHRINPFLSLVIITPIVYYSWAFGATSGLLVASHYSNSTIVFIIYLAIISILNLKFWTGYIQENDKKRKGKTNDLAELINMGLCFAILVPIIVFAIKPEWSNPYFSWCFDFFKDYLPSKST